MRRVGIILFPLLFSAAAVAQELVDVYKIDFGPKTTTPAGYIHMAVRTTDERFLWSGDDLSLRDRGGDDLITRDFVTGARGEFTVGLDNGPYEVRLVMGDSAFPHGPLDLFIQNQRVAEQVVTAAEEFLTLTFNADVDDERLRVRFEPVKGGLNFVVNAMIIRGAVQQTSHSVFGPRPLQESPTLGQLDAESAPDVLQALRAYCDWLVAHQQPNGFFDTFSSEWYRAAYPIRTLIAGYRIFESPEYLRAVTKLLDRFVGEQLPNGAWAPYAVGRPVAQRTPEEVNQAMAGTTQLADSGAIVTCLSVASRLVDVRRRRIYIESHRRHADQYALRFQLPSGGFTNGWWGRETITPYSVATGTQGMSFAALYAVTGKSRYLQVAERAVRFLLHDWQPDGRPTYHDFLRDFSYVERVTDFGNIYYYHEAILWVLNWTQDEDLKQAIRNVYDWHIRGEQGLLGARQYDVWWPPSPSTWENSKAGGMPLVLIAYDREMGQDVEVHEAVRRCAVFLSRPDFAERIGVMVDPDAPWGDFATPATGFAGLTLAELVKPGLIYLRYPARRSILPRGWAPRGTIRRR